MTRPTRATIWMLVFVATVAMLAAAAFAPLSSAFRASPVFNGFILGVLAVGVIINLRQVLGLGAEVAWLEEFRQKEMRVPGPSLPRLLAPMARMLGRREGATLSLSAPSMRSLLDGIRARLDESRDVARYMIGLLIFLGLLGTFWGLLATIGSVGRVIGGLSLAGGDAAAAFESLKAGLEQPLAGMGTAFSSSLFGLAGALILGFLDLQAGHAQNRFFNELEEWLSGVTHLSTGALAGEPAGSVPAYVHALLEKTADGLERLQRGLGATEQERRLAGEKLFMLTEQLARFTDQMRTEMSLLRGLAESQAELKPVLRRLAEGSSSGLDEPSRTHLRNLDVAVSRMHEESRAAVDRIMQELRDELRMLSRTIAAAAGTERSSSPEAGAQ